VGGLTGFCVALEVTDPNSMTSWTIPMTSVHQLCTLEEEAGHTSHLVLLQLPELANALEIVLDLRHTLIIALIVRCDTCKSL